MGKFDAQLKEIDKVIAEGKYKDTWESLVTYEVPEWFKKSRLGFFLHWGVYSVPAYDSEWYPRRMYYNTDARRHHQEVWGKEFEYHEFIPLFKAEKFNADAFLDTLSTCNCDFVMPVAEHHDGFKMYKSDLNQYNAYEMGPKRNLLQEFKDACEKKDVMFCCSSHRAEHFWYMNGTRTAAFETMTKKGEMAEFYGPCDTSYPDDEEKSWNSQNDEYNLTQEWLEDWLCSSCEIVDKYMPASMYFDFYVGQELAFRPYVRKFMAYYYNMADKRGKQVVFYNKQGDAMYPCGVQIVERGQLSGICPFPWQCETSTGKTSWGYTTNNQYKEPHSIACNLVDVWSKGGVCNLNIGPKADGTIGEQDLAILKELSTWLNRNKEAIWGTMCYTEYGEGEQKDTGFFKENFEYTKNDFRFLYKFGYLYIFVLNPYDEKEFTLKSIRKNRTTYIENIAVVGFPDLFDSYDLTREEGLTLRLKENYNDKMPLCFKVKLI